MEGFLLNMAMELFRWGTGGIMTEFFSQRCHPTETIFRDFSVIYVFYAII